MPIAKKMQISIAHINIVHLFRKQAFMLVKNTVIVSTSLSANMGKLTAVMKNVKVAKMEPNTEPKSKKM